METETQIYYCWCPINAVTWRLGLWDGNSLQNVIAGTDRRRERGRTYWSWWGIGERLPDRRWRMLHGEADTFDEARVQAELEIRRSLNVHRPANINEETQ